MKSLLAMSSRLLHIFLMIAVVSGTARAESLPEQTLRAAYLYHLAALTQWPRADDTPLNYCFYYGADYQPAIEILKTKKIAGRSIEIKHVDNPNATKYCDVLVIGTRDRYLRNTMLEEVAQKPILTIADGIVGDEAPIIHLIEEDKKIGFEVNLNAAKEAGIVLSSRLIRVAKKVIQ